LTNIVFSPEYEVLPALLTEYRRRAGVSQRELARRMGRAQSHINRLEARQTRIEVIEFCRFVSALEADPSDAFRELMARLQSRA